MDREQLVEKMTESAAQGLHEAIFGVGVWQRILPGERAQWCGYVRAAMRAALAAVLPLAVAEERAECAKVLEERIKEIQNNIDDNIAEVRVAEVRPEHNRPLIKARDWLVDVLAAIRSRGDAR